MKNNWLLNNVDILNGCNDYFMRDSTYASLGSQAQTSLIENVRRPLSMSVNHGLLTPLVRGIFEVRNDCAMTARNWLLDSPPYLPLDTSLYRGVIDAFKGACTARGTPIFIAFPAAYNLIQEPLRESLETLNIPTEGGYDYEE